ncbi:EPIDERMAL PATTERNING FACTOR-like protein 1 [Hibiscus syriacus]|uniref:EPIDERMAL PATTERNING FACTOR-like protein 1 n=1 Tax=Hibiscus syriacus TaxID=106335 RepID=UPI0019249CE1|nr:EPIDERMAL PATTERNING FACTOR-like protein 1 [Hibiscus syriacus]
MTSLIPSLLTFFLLLASASSLHRFQPANSPAPGSSFEEKTRLGSIPPSCHNRCNGCHPCMAVQVPTSPGSHHDRFKPGAAVTSPMQFFDPSGNQYSNYKPLGWKCSCGDHFYNPCKIK